MGAGRRQGVPRRRYTASMLDDLTAYLAPGPARLPVDAVLADDTDRLILSTAEDEGLCERDGDVLIIDDAHGALTLATLRRVTVSANADPRNANPANSCLENADLANSCLENADRGNTSPESASPGSVGPGDTGYDAASAGLDRNVVVWCASQSAALAVRESVDAAITAGALDERAHAQLKIAGLDPNTPVDLGELMATHNVSMLLMRLPKTLAALERTVYSAAHHGCSAIVAGGRIKHMNLSQNEVLSRGFERVHATRGLKKARCLVAQGPLAHGAQGPLAHGAQGPSPHMPEAGEASAVSSEWAKDNREVPQTLQTIQETLQTIRGAAPGRAPQPTQGQWNGIELRGIGGVFGSAKADAGSVLLLETLRRSFRKAPSGHPVNRVERAIDFGCGNGLLTAELARLLPDAEIIGSDDDLDAVSSTRATLAASGLEREGIHVRWDHSLSQERDASADLIVLNPPFHQGYAIVPGQIQALFDACARVLRPGGELWVVHNSHLRYRMEMERRVGPVDQLARDRRFTVLRATAV